MNKITAAITCLHGYVPPDILTNADLEKMVDTSDEWIMTRTGIKERRIQKEPGKATSDMAVEAVNGLLKKRGISAEEIDLIIFATITGDMIFPSSACVLADKIGAKNAWGYDLSAACSGFLFALETGATFIQSGKYKKVVVIGGDKMSSIIDYTDRNTCIIFGDGLGCVLLEPNEEGYGVRDSILKIDGSGRHYLYQKAGGSLKPPTHETIDAREHYVFQDGKTVFKFAVTNMAEVSANIMERNNLTSEDVTWLVPHQANLRIIDATAERMGLGRDKVMINIDHFGNTTNGTLPLLLWEWESKLKKGDNLILSAFGGGFTWGAMYIKWAYDASASAY
ncbi:MAG: beta-ketoacyl-ACP synthase III [Bacteroidota bacterium]|jgi:3-oxoacyl-[acyl-carrier-protein] synthase-3|nr:ketoacyl-ACP synthase III [Sphingobacteriales bacterium]